MEYRFERRLARGGMGIVDLARAPDGTRVALKRLTLHGTVEDMHQARRRFQRERDVLAGLEHEAIVPLLDVLDDDDELVLVMPYLAGGNLAERVTATGPLPTNEVRALRDRLLGALAVAHRQGVIHRDIKPANVLFDADGHAYLADFGVALSHDVTQGLTQTGMVVGTPAYLSPEQARGDALTTASDIASLGATLHFAATGRSPYGTGEPGVVLLRAATGKVDLDRSIDRDLRRELTAMLAPDPFERPSAAALLGGAGGTTVLPRPARRRVPLAPVLTAVVVGLLGAGLIWAGLSDSDGEGAATSSTTATSAVDTTTTAPPCTPLPYQPCGAAPAPNTDGEQCIGGHADYDGIAMNGCEAVPDTRDGTELVESLTANIVPADDTDRYPMNVDDAADVLCNNTIEVRLEAPDGVTLRLVVENPGGEVVGEATASPGVPGVVRLRDPQCFFDNAGTYNVTVAPVGSDRTGASYVLRRSGSF